MINGIPKNEHVWVNLRPHSGDEYYITTKADDRSTYFLYKSDGGKAHKIGKAKTPIELEEKVWVN